MAFPVMSPYEDYLLFKGILLANLEGSPINLQGFYFSAEIISVPLKWDT